VAYELIDLLAPSAVLLVVAVAIDLAIGDPVYGWHPIRLLGGLLTAIETRLRALGADGYGGGVLLFAMLSGIALSVTTLLLVVSSVASIWVARAVHAFLLYSLLALGDLVHHVLRIERAVRAGDLSRARDAVRALVGRDTDRMDGAACRRAAVESLSESLTDGFVSPLCWYVLAGVPGLVLFKVVSTMDSMIGYKTPQYLRFGWCGARLDDLMNYVPARLTWVVITLVALILPGYSSRKAWTIGLRQHGILPGPNSGWSEAATAGALERRLVGPIWLNGALVTDVWLGEPTDPPLVTSSDVTRAIVLAVVSGLTVVAAGVLVMFTKA
jgi:adenosylcobinamide-phosphate synthase